MKVGDVVRLKSGGPLMTVSSLGEDGDEHEVYTQWFDLRRDEGHVLREGAFYEAGALEVVPPRAHGANYVRGEAHELKAAARRALEELNASRWTFPVPEDVREWRDSEVAQNLGHVTAAIRELSTALEADQGGAS